MPNTFPAETLTKPVSEDRDFGFDFTDAPEIQGGATIASAVIVSPPAGLTFGSVSINVALFDGIAIGKAAVVEISGGTDNTTYAFGCKATLSTGRKLVIPAKLAVCGDAE